MAPQRISFGLPRAWILAQFIITLVVIGPACKEEPDTDYMVALVQLEFMQCLAPGAVDLIAGEPNWIAVNCRSGYVQTGLIHLNADGSRLETTSVASGTGLECRCGGGSLSSARYGKWYRSPALDPPLGHRLEFLGNQPVQLSGNQVVAVLPFSGFASGDVLFCAPSELTIDSCNNMQKVKVQ